MTVRGTKASGGTDFVTGYTIAASEMNTDLNALDAAITNITIADANVIAGANIDPSKVGDYSATAVEMRSVANPFTASTWSAATESLATNLEEELARIRHVLAALTSGTYWYSRANQGSLVHTTGDLKWTLKTSADTGWILLVDGTISSTAGAGSVRNNDDTVDLYALLWTNFSDTLCPVSSGRGASAAADFAANKTLRLPQIVGRTVGVAGNAASTNRVDSITGTATAGSAAPAGTTITMSANGTAPTKNDAIAGYTIEITAGAGSGQSRTISTYVASTRVITNTVAWATTTDNTSVYAIYKDVPTRTLGETLGTDLTIPTLDTMAAHTHLSVAGGGGDVLAYPTVVNATTPTNPTSSTGNGTPATNYSPTWFGNLMVKL